MYNFHDLESFWRRNYKISDTLLILEATVPITIPSGLLVIKPPVFLCQIQNHKKWADYVLHAYCITWVHFMSIVRWLANSACHSCMCAVFSMCRNGLGTDHDLLSIVGQRIIFLLNLPIAKVICYHRCHCQLISICKLVG